ncbi:xylosyltransferase oxt [Sitophilus oryzae]|uniref:protein xylosyltransferase n=1 Tax=Sitophilus oryzae TaxID=7048 RepID=A0A6J2YSQ1_SITOR|nr:xylosyltransferase oxt [Sitophilus oryzae]
MVKSTSKNKYLRRYRVCFIIGMVILSFQILVVINFLSHNKSTEEPEKWEPSDSDRDSGSNNEALNSARRSDDEETNLLAPQTKKTSNNTVQLKVEELNFDLPCHITEKQAISALTRAKTQRCKQVIANISCQSLENQLYPLELRSSCPVGNFVKGKELGCFKDDKKFRLLNGYFGVSKSENSPKYCINICLQSGFPYAGVQYGNECFCGSDEPLPSSKIPDSSCNMKCPADSHSTCGGYYTINIYQTGIKKFVAQVANETVTNVKSSRIVFLLTLNGRALRQVMRLIKILYQKQHFYYIHVDVRQDYLFRELLPLEKFRNIKLTRKRFATIWGGASLLAMLRSCMFELLNVKDWKWDFVLNLSESDFPVKSIEKLTHFLSSNTNRNFVKSHGREVQRFIQKQGLDKTFVECEYRMWRVGNRKLPLGIQIDGGSDWIALSRPFVQYIADPEPDSLIQGLLKVFKHTLLPAESFFHTALRNSKFCNTYVDNNLHVTNWKRKLGCKCQYKHVVDWCGCSPNDFRSEDWPKILNTLSRPLYFARKFEPIVNQMVILQLELWLYNMEKPSKQVQNLYSYWQNLYHHHDLGVALDDSLMTLGNSVFRTVFRKLSNMTTCNIELHNLLQVHSFHLKDNYKYTLFLYNSSWNGNISDIEVAVKPVSKTIKVKTNPLIESLISLGVSSEYDQKEQLSRNFLRILSPYSDPVLIYKFSSLKTSKQYNMTCLWIDPTGTLRDVSGYSIEEGSLVGFVKPNLRQPHIPGSWKVRIIYSDSLLAQVSFLIMPMLYHYGSPEMSMLHPGPTMNSNLGEAFAKFLPNVSEREISERNAVKNSQKRGDSLLEWIDSLVGLFFSIETVCVDSTTVRNVCRPVGSSCQETDWSSLAPDPKSAIDKANDSTGMFDIW